MKYFVPCDSTDSIDRISFIYFHPPRLRVFFFFFLGCVLYLFPIFFMVGICNRCIQIGNEMSLVMKQISPCATKLFLCTVFFLCFMCNELCNKERKDWSSVKFFADEFLDKRNVRFTNSWIYRLHVTHLFFLHFTSAHIAGLSGTLINVRHSIRIYTPLSARFYPTSFLLVSSLLAISFFLPSFSTSSFFNYTISTAVFQHRGRSRLYFVFHQARIHSGAKQWKAPGPRASVSRYYHPLSLLDSPTPWCVFADPPCQDLDEFLLSGS